MQKTGRLTENGMHVMDGCRRVKCRLKDAGLSGRLAPHSFRVTTITDLLERGVPLEDVPRLAGHADPRTTRLYDRRDKKITRNIVERISIQKQVNRPGRSSKRSSLQFHRNRLERLIAQILREVFECRKVHDQASFAGDFLRLPVRICEPDIDIGKHDPDQSRVTMHR